MCPVLDLKAFNVYGPRTNRSEIEQVRFHALWLCLQLQSVTTFNYSWLATMDICKMTWRGHAIPCLVGQVT